MNSVIYTDGAAKPQNMYIGFGVHGYYYNTTQDKVSRAGDKFLITDIGYINSNDKNKYKFNYVKPTNYINIVGSYREYTTNNVAELLAIYYGLKTTYKDGLESILIYTDSKYSITMVEKILNNKEFKKDTANIEILNDIKDLINKHRDVKITLKYIPSHSGYLGNVLADKYAFLGVLESKRLIEKYGKDSKIEFIKNSNDDDINKYFNPSKDIPDILFPNKLYFFNNRYTNVYPFIERVVDMVGKKNNEISYGIIKLDKDIDRITELGNIFREEVTKDDILTIVDKDTLYKPLYLQLYSLFGKKIYHKLPYDKLECIAILKQDDDQYDSRVLIPNLPAGLGKRVESHIEALHNILNQYNNNTLKAYKLIDITDKFIDVKEDKKGNKKYELKKHITNTVKDVKVTVDIGEYEVDIFITLGLDIPNRNVINRLAKHNPKISLLLMNTPDMIGYYTIIDIPSLNQQVIMTNFYTDYIYLDSYTRKRKKK